MSSRPILAIGFTLLLSCFPDASGQRLVDGPDFLIDQLYEVLSGPPGEHDWELFQSLFHADSVMGSVVADQDGRQTYRSTTPEEYVERNDEFFRTRGFYVNEVHRITEQFGEVLHLFSTYEYRVDSQDLQQPAGLQQSGRGINSIQLIHEANRWWIVSIQYTNERPDLPVPKRYGG